jgi:hypothetical protein
VELVAKGNHKTTQALASMKKLKAGMNNNRQFFTWEHLVVFYKPAGPGVSQHAVQSAGKI